MQSFPHHYDVTAGASPDGDVQLGSDHLPVLKTATPPEFDGPGGRWSPETLFVAAIADCFVLTFRGVARASKLPWLSLGCDATGTLDRQDGISRFTDVYLRASLIVPAGVDAALATRLLKKAEERCLISRSLNGTVHLESRVSALAPPVAVHAADRV
jgi:organic hydroperoxide reductase OsmC/OhrA